MNEGITVLSLFDGLSGGQIALERAGIKVRKYYSSEIDRYAMQITQKHYPNTIQLGDINNWQEWDIDVPDLILAGSPCQGFSNAGRGLNFDDPRSKLFFVFCDILAYYQEKNPSLKYMLENVKMKKEWRDVITDRMKVEPCLINSALVSAQNRERLYWANWTFPQPDDRHIYLKDIVECGEVDRLKSYTIDANYFKGGNPRSYFEDGKRQLVFEHQSHKRAIVKVRGAAIRNQVTKRGVEEQLNVRKDEKSNCVVPTYPNKLNGVVIGRQVGRRINNGKRDDYNKSIQPKQRIEVTRIDDKSGTLSTVQKDNLLVFAGMADDIKGHDIVRRVYSSQGKSPTLTNMQGGHRQPKIALDEYYYRKLTPLECERLQTVPEGYTEGVSNTRRYAALGNGWTIDVIAHILSYMNKEQSL